MAGECEIAYSSGLSSGVSVVFNNSKNFSKSQFMSLGERLMISLWLSRKTDFSGRVDRDGAALKAMHVEKSWYFGVKWTKALTNEVS